MGALVELKMPSSYVRLITGLPTTCLSDNEQGHGYVVICQPASSPPPPPVASRPPSLLCLFSHQLLINSSWGISCLPPSLPCSCSKWDSILALFTKHQLLNTPQLSHWNMQTNCLKDIAPDSGDWRTSYSATAIDDFVLSMGSAYAQTHNSESDEQPWTESQ